MIGSLSRRGRARRRRGGFAGAAGFVLDLIGVQPVGAWSLRRLTDDYDGDAITVRRLNDDATLDVGFTASGDLDKATLTSFVGENTAVVEAWFDQSGRGNDLIKTGTNRPTIILNGVLWEEGGRPVIDFDNTHIEGTSVDADLLGTNDDFTAFAVHVGDSTFNDPLYSWGGNDNDVILYPNDTQAGAGAIRVFVRQYTDTEPLVEDVASITGQWVLTTLRLGDGDQEGWRDGLSRVSNTEPGTFGAATRFDVASLEGGSQRLSGRCGELIVVPGDRRADREAVEANMADYWGITLEEA